MGSVTDDMQQKWREFLKLEVQLLQARGEMERLEQLRAEKFNELVGKAVSQL